MDINYDIFVHDRNKDSLTDIELSKLNLMSDDEIKEYIDYCENQYNYYNSMQLGLKLILNSVYGTFGNEYYVCSTADIANAITIMGRDTIKYMDKINEEYWYNYWHLDTELHEKLGISNVEKIDDTWLHKDSGTVYNGEVTISDIDDGIYQRKCAVSPYIDTDSVDAKTVLNTTKGIMSIEDLYKYSESFGTNGETIAGHESVKTDAKILNYTKEKGLYYANIKRVIKHKVNKPKYKLKTKSGKTVYVTADHSLVVFRNGKQLVVKPNEIIKGDNVVELITNETYKFEDIELCEIVGQFEDEYVYDIEVDDETHTFIADDILVHNSVFVSFDWGMKSCNWGDENHEKFIHTICENRLEKLFETKLIGYAKKFNVNNIQNFELENINESVLFVTKKKYIKHVIWEDGRKYDRLTNITPKGVNLIKKGTPAFAREKVMNIINYIFDNPDTYNIKDLLKYVRGLRQEFELVNIDDISPTTNINNYWGKKIKVDGVFIDGPGIVEDKERLIWGKGTYYTIKSAGLYNHLLYQHPDLINDYDIIKPGTKVKIYPTTHEINNKFCYILGAYPAEFAPPVDYDELFQKTVADQANYYMEALGLPLLNKRLKIILSLF